MLAQRGGYEQAFIAEVADKLARRAVLIPWLAQATVGAEGLTAQVA